MLTYGNVRCRWQRQVDEGERRDGEDCAWEEGGDRKWGKDWERKNRDARRGDRGRDVDEIGRGVEVGDVGRRPEEEEDWPGVGRSECRRHFEGGGDSWQGMRKEGGR